MELKPGLKQTEIGIFPNEWGVSTIGALALTSSGTTPPRAKSDRYFRNGKIPWVKTLDLNNSELRSTDEKVTEAALLETSLQRYPAGSVLVAMYGGYNQIGRTGLLAIPAAVNQALTAIRPDPKKLSSAYLLRVLNYRVGYWRSVASSSRKDPNITGKDIVNFPLAVPPIDEQEAIAEALSDADVFIEYLEQLLGKKRCAKQGAMQELLAGKKRLPGFSENWHETNLGSLFTFKNGLNKAKKFFGHGTPIVNYMDVFANSKLLSEDLNGRVDVTKQEIINFEVKKGDVLFTRTSETPDEIGLASVVLDQPKNTVFSGFVLRGRPEDERLDNQFKAYCFRSSAIRKQIISKASYTTRALTNGRLLSAVSLSFPSTPEQSAIASILSDLDADITMLESKLRKARDLKKGMMQELLTGRIRLI